MQTFEQQSAEHEDFLSVFNLLAQYSVFSFSVHSDLWQEETRFQGPGAKELSPGRCRRDGGRRKPGGERCQGAADGEVY